MVKSQLYASTQRQRLVSAGICLFFALLAGCARSTPTPEPVTISFAYPENYGGHFEPLADEFQKSNPHITVELRPVPNTVFYQTFWVGDADSSVIGTYSTLLRMMLEQGHILDLSPLFEADGSLDEEDFYLGEAGFLASENGIWGIPIGAYLTVMYYNQDLFDYYGVSYPEPGWTWKDFLDTALALRDPDAGVFGYGPTDFDAIHFVYQHGGRLLDSLQSPTHATYDDPLTVEALEWYAALFYEHDVAPTPDQVQETFGSNAEYAVYGAIQRGQVGMWMGGLFQQGTLGGEEVHFRWGMVPLPRDTQAATLTTGEYLFVFAEAQHPKTCGQWLSFVSQHVSPEGLVPVRRSQVESERYVQLVGDEVATVVQATASDLLIVSPMAYGELGTFGQAVEGIVAGRNTPYEAMKWAQQEVERTLP